MTSLKFRGHRESGNEILGRSVWLFGMLLLVFFAFAPPVTVAQEDGNWREHVDEDDERAVGYVVEIEDNYFTLRIHGEEPEEFRFDSERNPEIWDDLKVGDRVQVWYDPERQSRDEVAEAWYYWAHYFMAQQEDEAEESKGSDDGSGGR